MGKGKRIALGTTLAGLVGLGGLLYYDSSPSPTEYLQVERPSHQVIVDKLNPMVLTPPKDCPQYLIVRDISPVPSSGYEGWDVLNVETDLHNDSSCLGDKAPEWEGDLVLGLFGRWEERGRSSQYIFGKAQIVVRWEGAGKDNLDITSKEKSVVVPDSNSWIIMVPKAAQDRRIDVDFRGGITTNMRDVRDAPYVPGFSKDTKLPTSSAHTIEGRPQLDEKKARDFVEQWLQDNKSRIVRNTGQPLQEAPQEAYEEWFRQKIGEFMIDNNLDKYRDTAITRLDMEPTGKGLKISLELSNPTFTENIELYSAGFTVTDVLDSRGKLLKHYDEPIRFPLTAQNKSLAPKYSAEGKITIRHHHSFPKDATYLVGSLTLGRYGSESGRVNPPPRLYHDPVVVDIATIGEPEFRGRLGIRGWVLDRFDSIRESLANQ